MTFVKWVQLARRVENRETNIKMMKALIHYHDLLLSSERDYELSVARDDDQGTEAGNKIKNQQFVTGFLQRKNMLLLQCSHKIYNTPYFIGISYFLFKTGHIISSF
jgi:hypothetical protein